MKPIDPTDRLVVVGASLAGVTLVDAVRRHGFTGPLTLVGAEPQKAYNRPALSKGVLNKGTADCEIELPPLTCAVDEIVGTAAKSIDLERRTVTLEDGTLLPYDRLAVTTGARARRMADLGAADVGVRETTLRDLNDAHSLSTALLDRPHVVIVGAGILGMEIASACVDRGASVVIIDQQAPLHRQLGDYLSNVVTQAAVERGVTVIHHPGGVRLKGTGTPIVELSDGRRFEGDLVVSAVGCVANVDWLASSGLLSAGELRTDSRCVVGSGVVAAGDVAAFPGTDGHRRTPWWNSALEQARTAARTLVEGDTAPPLRPEPYFWTEQFGLSIRIRGSLPAHGQPVVVEGHCPADGLLLTWPDRHGEATAAAINKRVPISRLRDMTLPKLKEVQR